MKKFLKTALLLATTLTLSLSGAVALADSTSSASSASSTSIGSSSTSIEKSSNSSSAKEKVAQGHYKVLDVAALADNPDMLRVRLQAVLALETASGAEPSAPFDLLLARQAAERAQLAAGHIIAAEHRPYGVAFATIDTGGKTSPFFLVLDDVWYRELESRPVVI